MDIIFHGCSIAVEANTYVAFYEVFFFIKKKQKLVQLLSSSKHISF